MKYHTRTRALGTKNPVANAELAKRQTDLIVPLSHRVARLRSLLPCCDDGIWPHTCSPHSVPPVDLAETIQSSRDISTLERKAEG